MVFSISPLKTLVAGAHVHACNPCIMSVAIHLSEIRKKLDSLYSLLNDPTIFNNPDNYQEISRLYNSYVIEYDDISTNNPQIEILY
jgi:hypothetical protein